MILNKLERNEGADKSIYDVSISIKSLSNNSIILSFISSYIPSKFMEVVVNEVGATKINFILLPSDAVEGIL